MRRVCRDSNTKLFSTMTGTELLSHALILDALQERGLIDQDTLHDQLDKLIEQDRAEAEQIELEALNAVEDD